MLPAREELLSRRQQFKPTSVHGNGTVQYLWLRFGHRLDMVHQRRESSLQVRWRLQQLHSLGSRDKPVQHADGSTDLYLGPKAPDGQEKNWLATVPGKGYFAVLRLYGPTEPALTRTWKPGDITKMS